MEEINIYCDESCHLEHDHNDIMVIGAISCDKRIAKEINTKIKTIKEKHNIYRHSEIKWVKVSDSKIDFYKELIDLFYSYDDVFFRAVIALDKTSLKLESFNLTYDEWYYRIYYIVLKHLVSFEYTYNIYIDIKDTKGSRKINKLKDVLNRTLYDFIDSTVKNIQLVRSDQIDIMGLADLLIGAVSYKNRELKGSDAKLELIEYIEKKRGYALNISSPKKENKFNTFKWRPRNV